MGFIGPEPNALFDSIGKPSPLGLLQERVYVTGDALSGPSLVVKAIASGIRTAKVVLSDMTLLRIAL
jgi:hypothetical protein